MNLYAQIVIGRPVEGPFDYLVPQAIENRIMTGSRVRVNFAGRKCIGYIVGLSNESKIKNLKSIISLIDDKPVIGTKMLLFTRRLSEYYCCSWGEMIESSLPQELRRGMPAIVNAIGEKYGIRAKPQAYFFQESDDNVKWDFYIKEIKAALENNQSVIIILPDMILADRALERLNAQIGVPVGAVYQKNKDLFNQWLLMKEGKVKIACGTRSAVFSPVDNLGLLILDEESEQSYKQEQVPHYHARQAAFMRSDIDGAKLIFGSMMPSLEIAYLCRNKAIINCSLPLKEKDAEVKIVDTKCHGYGKKKEVFSQYSKDLINLTLNGSGKVLIFAAQEGFAALAVCPHCGFSFNCQRCSAHLVYHLKNGLMSCRYCNFTQSAAKICPSCKASYIKYFGSGREKIKSELNRIFPDKRIKDLDSPETFNINDGDIFIFSRSTIRHIQANFDLVVAVGIDTILGRVDFRAAEKTFVLLWNLLKFSGKKLIIQTDVPKHYCFKALESKNSNIFYDEELKQRKQLNFPPYAHLGVIKLRGISEDKVKKVCEVLFQKLEAIKKPKIFKLISASPARPLKRRGRFSWEILLIFKNPPETSNFLKMQLKTFRHSGIIVTVDIDP